MELSDLVPFAHEGWWVTVFLVTLRIGAIFVLTPPFSHAAIPATVRVLFVFSLAVALSLALPLPAPSMGVRGDISLLFAAAFSEVALGLALGLGVQLAFAACGFAGRLLDVQIGLGLVQVFDPATRGRSSAFASLFDQLAVLMFFLLSVHHVVLRGLAWSFERFPPGQSMNLAQALAPLLKQVAAMYALGLALAAPVVCFVLLTELALGIVAQSLPQMNMLLIGMPVKIVAGLLALALWAPQMGGVLARIYETIHATWSQVLASAPPRHAEALG
ncbi:flagellar biosynthetic protein FliR [Ramlibacter sp.]|uniref:flagellar biosynthetic protein FliR n=1 Tax=Ramlibacter sp. TaxID=1917967 RepID=UPI003D122E9C